MYRVLVGILNRPELSKNGYQWMPLPTKPAFNTKGFFTNSSTNVKEPSKNGWRWMPLPTKPALKDGLNIFL